MSLIDTKHVSRTNVKFIVKSKKSARLVNGVGAAVKKQSSLPIPSGLKLYTENRIE